MYTLSIFFFSSTLQLNFSHLLIAAADRPIPPATNGLLFSTADKTETI